MFIGLPRAGGYSFIFTVPIFHDLNGAKSYIPKKD